MGYLLDVLIAIPIGLLYTYIINNISDIFTADIVFEQKIQRTLIFGFISGILGYIIALLLFNQKCILDNRSVKYGLFFGSSLLLINTLLFNWYVLDNDTRLFIMGAIFIFFISLSYKMKSK